MKKLPIFLCLPLLFSCGDVSSSSSTSPLSFDTYLKSIEKAYEVNAILEDKESHFQQGNKTLYLNQNDEKAYGIASLSFEENNIQAETMETYFADEEGYVYQEYLTPMNQVEKDYVLVSKQRIFFDRAFQSVFSILQNEVFIKDEENHYSFSHEETLNSFVQQFIQGNYETLSAYFTFEQEQLSFYLDTTSFIFSVQVLQYGDTIKIEHLTPFVLDKEEKPELQSAIEELQTNYRVTHYRTGYKTQVYYMDQTILLDDSANGLSSQDSYYYYQDNEDKMTRLVFGKKYVVGNYSWDEDNYQDMNYTKTSFDELSIRLTAIDLGFFKDNHDGTYTSIEGAASLLFPYCQPAMNVRQDFVNKAISVTIELKEGHLYKIKLKYIYNPYGGEGYDRSDTIVFEQIGGVTLPQSYYNSLNLHDDVTLPDEIQGTFEGKVNDKTIRLTLFSSCEATYEVDGVSYTIPKVNYSFVSDQIEIGFTYANEKRSVSLVYNSSAHSLEGSDSSLEDIFEDFFNMDLFKIENEA